MSKVRHIVFCLILPLFFGGNCLAQSIYAGGSGDGYSTSSFAQVSNPLFDIYAGGNSDGHSINCFAQADNPLFDIYKGGNEDGFSVGCFAQVDNPLFDIYKGGDEDGFSLGCFAQPDNILYDIYKGGNEDGFSFSCFAQPDNVLYDIYKGGIADGYAFATLGGPGTEVYLPIVLLKFEGRYENNLVYLDWETATEINNDYFIIERSRTGIEFTELHKISGAGTTQERQQYAFTDEKPYAGINYYRLKQVDYDKASTYSNVLSVYADIKSVTPVITVYPNPTDGKQEAYIVLQGFESGTLAEVMITNAFGQNIHTFTGTTDNDFRIAVPSNISSGLAIGVYIVTVRHKYGQLTTKWIVK